jgi:hypothetical protein
MISIEQEPFIGMWRERSDMKDSTAFVRHLRTAQWPRPDARRGPSPAGVRSLSARSER